VKNRMIWTGGLLVVVATVLSALAQTSDSLYVYGESSVDGTGKFYMGREIAPVMGHRGAEWLERTSREREDAPRELIEQLGLASTDVVADIGAGTGYFTFRLSPRVREGMVLAVDIQREMLDIIADKLR
jgi:SAM-dependent methyltransferase